MTKCPKCNEDIKRLKLVVTKIQTIYYDGKDFDEDEYSYPTDTTEEWVCPECDYVFEDFDDGYVTEFLENDKLKEIVSEKIKEIKKA